MLVSQVNLFAPLVLHITILLSGSYRVLGGQFVAGPESREGVEEVEGSDREGGGGGDRVGVGVDFTAFEDRLLRLL